MGDEREKKKREEMKPQKTVLGEKGRRIEAIGRETGMEEGGKRKKKR